MPMSSRATPNTCETAPGSAAVSSRFTFEESAEMPGPSTTVDAELTSETVTVDAAYVERQLADIARDTDLSKYVL